MHVRRVKEQSLWRDWRRKLIEFKGSIEWGLETERLRESREFESLATKQKRFLCIPELSDLCGVQQEAREGSNP